MEQYINKNELVKEIKKLLISAAATRLSGKIDLSYWEGQKHLCERLLSFLDTIRVKEVDLQKEYEEFVVDDPILGNFIINDTMDMKLAKHFYELGLNEQKGK